MGNSSNSFKPELAGTKLPDGSRWGEFYANEARIEDQAGIFASQDIEVIVSGVRWTEGPVWVASEKALYFVDTVDARIYRWHQKQGVHIMASRGGGYDGTNVPDYETLFEPGPNGMALKGDEIVICQHPTRRVIKTKLADLKKLGGQIDCWGMCTASRDICKAPFEVLAEAAPNGRRLNAPNDVIVAPNGDIFFTDPVYGFLKKQPQDLGYAYLNAEKGEHPDQPYLDEAVQQIGAGITGVYRWRAGAPLELVTSELARPNGLALSPDGTMLWVANSVKDTPSWHCFPLRDQLPLQQSEMLSEKELGPAIQLGPGLSDGFKFDENGRIWSSVPGGIAVIDVQQKRVLATVKFNTNISNLRFGDDGDVFITGLGHVWRLKRTMVV